MGAELINTANVLIKDKVNSDLINKKRAKIAQNISKNIKIDGFRKGKVPLSVIESRYKDKITQDSQQEALNEKINDHLKKLNIELKNVIGSPIFLKYEIINDNIDFEVKLGILPKLDIEDISKFIPDIKLESISKDSINNKMEEFAKSNGKLIEVEKTLENGDIANIDFEGFINGEAFDGGKAKGYDLEIGSKSFIEGFEDKLIGMKKDQSKDIELKFPENYTAHLAGKDVVFKVKLNAVKKREIAKIDDELAKKILIQNDNATLKDLEEFAKIQLENEEKNKLINENKPKLVENLLSSIDFDIPENIIEQEMDIIFRNNIQKIKEEELKELQQDKNKAKEKRETFREEAQKSVKLTFIVDFLSKKNNISVSDNEVYQMLYYEAMMIGANPKELLENYEKNNVIPALKMTILENKVLNNLLESKLQNKE
ncbi:trigger factor [Helicobacter sp. MIT 14-3879]|uniref:trigger factor n=1 Tax=Helicobacter sp. MIT 14-3879 TaxID=2040649 RepID=UPI000E1E8C4F|nr:trigger factor [Helicobacter sp. MIT 14-3879]RDU65037.1 trigger factor [Helicobacter sp. MIT 14-3879]